MPFTVLNPQQYSSSEIPFEVRIENAVVRYNQALHLFRQNELEPARDIFQELLEELQNDEISNGATELTRAQSLRYLVHKNFSHLLNKRGETELAIAQAHLALDIEGTDAYLWCDLGELLSGVKRFSEATDALITGLKLSTGKLVRLRCVRNICECLFNMGEFEMCLEYLNKFMDVDVWYYRSIWIRNQIHKEYSKTLKFVLMLGSSVGDYPIVSQLLEVVEGSRHTTSLLEQLERSNPRLFEAISKPKVGMLTENEARGKSREEKKIEVPIRSFAALGRSLLEEFCHTFNANDEPCAGDLSIITVSVPDTKINLEEACSENVDTDEVSGGINQDKHESVPYQCPSDPAKCPLDSSPQEVPSASANRKRKMCSLSEGRRASKRLETRATREKSWKCDSDERFEEMLEHFTSSRCGFEVDMRFFTRDKSISSVVSQIHSKLVSPHAPQKCQERKAFVDLENSFEENTVCRKINARGGTCGNFENRMAARKCSAGVESLVDAKAASLGRNSEDLGEKCTDLYEEELLETFLGLISDIPGDIAHLVRCYVLFSVTGHVDISKVVDHGLILSGKWSEGVRECLIDIIKELEKHNMGSSFWTMQSILENSWVSFFSLILSLSELMSDFSDTESCQGDEVSRDGCARHYAHVSNCSCEKCILFKFTNILEFTGMTVDLTRELKMRWCWLLAKHCGRTSGDFTPVETLENINNIYKECQLLLDGGDRDGDVPMLTYNKKDCFITRQSLRDKFLLVEIQEICLLLLEHGLNAPEEYIQKLVNIHLVDVSTGGSSYNKELCTVFMKDISAYTREKLQKVFREACMRNHGGAEILKCSSVLFAESVRDLCNSDNIISSMERCTERMRDCIALFERQRVPDSRWVDILGSCYGITSSLDLSKTLLDFFLGACYVTGAVSWALIKDRENWMCATGKLLYQVQSDILERFCISSCRMLIPFISCNHSVAGSPVSNGSGKVSMDLENSIFMFMSLTHHHLSMHYMCSASNGEFLLDEISLLGSFSDLKDEEETKVELNQCFRCLYNVYLKGIPTEDHQTNQQRLTKDHALELFLEIRGRIENRNLYISKAVTQDYVDTLTKIGETLGNSVFRNKSLLLHNTACLERYIRQAPNFTIPPRRIATSLFPVPFAEFESDQKMTSFGNDFHYILGKALRNQSIYRRGSIQLVNSEKVVSLLSLSIKKFKKCLCIVADRWEAWFYLCKCYTSLENEHFSRSANHIYNNWEQISELRQSAFLCHIAAAQFCEDKLSTCEHRAARRELLNNLGKIWGSFGTLCYDMYNLPVADTRATKAKRKACADNLIHRVCELKFMEDDSSAGNTKDDLFRINKNRSLCTAPTTFLCEKTSAMTRLRNSYYSECLNFRLPTVETPHNVLDDDVLSNQAFEWCLPFKRPVGPLKFCVFSLKKAVAHQVDSKGMWLYYMLLGDACFDLRAPIDTVVNYYMTSISLSSKDGTAKDQDIILDPYIKLARSMCMCLINKTVDPNKIVGIVNNAINTGSLARRKPPEKQADDLQKPPARGISNSERVGVANGDPSSTTGGDVVVDNVHPDQHPTQTDTKESGGVKDCGEAAFEALITLLGQIKIASKKGWYHEHVYLISLLHYFMRGDAEEAKNVMKSLFRLQEGKTKGFLNLWRSEHERPGHIYIFTYKYIFFELHLFKSTKDTKSLRRIIRKLGKAEGRLLWPKQVTRKASDICMEHLKMLVEKHVGHYSLTQEDCVDLTALEVPLSVVSSEIAVIFDQELSTLMDILCFAFEIGEYLTGNRTLEGLQLSIYGYFIHRFRVYLQESKQTLEVESKAEGVDSSRAAVISAVTGVLATSHEKRCSADIDEKQVLVYASVLAKSITTRALKK